MTLKGFGWNIRRYGVLGDRSGSRVGDFCPRAGRVNGCRLLSSLNSSIVARGRYGCVLFSTLLLKDYTFSAESC